MPVIDVKTTRQEPYAQGRAFGDSGAYERIDGVLTFAVDPENPANQQIVDLDLAPRDPQGRVIFKSDFTLLAPQNADLGNRRLIVDVVNRGRRRVVSTFNMGPAPAEGSGGIPEGDGFLFCHGYSIVSIGWQWDVYASEELLGLEAPQAGSDGVPLRGQTAVEIRPVVVERTRRLADRVHAPYPAADVDDPDAVLYVREWDDGPDTVVPRGQWRFAQETDPGVVASDGHIYLESGFQPGKIYNVAYTTAHAPVVGCGLLAIREVGAWLRHASSLNPIEGGFERAYAYGVSQTGRMLRHFVYLGLNLDEEGRAVFDGLLPHVAGSRRGEFNHRFAHPSLQSRPGLGHLPPFTDDDRTDPFTSVADGLLKRQRALGGMPKIVYTNSSAEYWRGDGSLQHIDPAGPVDLDPVPETRNYHFTGAQHGAGSVSDHRASISSRVGGRYPLNVVDYRPLLRAALINLDRWLDGVEPPPSRHPRLDDGSAVTRGEVLASFNGGPDVVKPDPDRLWVVREVDLGPGAEAGAARYPVTEGRTYQCFASAVDGDGNEVGGIRLPDLEVPVGTHAGWNLRAPETGSPEQIVSMQGFTSFFAATRALREGAGDDRLSIEERYTDRKEYLARVREAARRLVSERYLLEEDLETVVSACAERYDFAVRVAAPAEVPVGDDS